MILILPEYHFPSNCLSTLAPTTKPSGELSPGRRRTLVLRRGCSLILFVEAAVSLCVRFVMAMSLMTRCDGVALNRYEPMRGPWTIDAPRLCGCESSCAAHACGEIPRLRFPFRLINGLKCPWRQQVFAAGGFRWDVVEAWISTECIRCQYFLVVR